MPISHLSPAAGALRLSEAESAKGFQVALSALSQITLIAAVEEPHLHVDQMTITLS